MKILIRLAFALLILLSVIAQLYAIRPGDAGRKDLASLAAPLAGLGLKSTPPDADGVIAAAAAGCAPPVRIGMYWADGSEAAWAASVVGPDAQPRYVYLGEVFRTADSWPIYLRGLEGNFAAMIGARSRRAPDYMVLVALPDACPQLADLDWSVLSPWH